MKLKTELYKEGKLQTTAEYSGAYVYENGNISYINIPGGRIRKDALHASHYEYNFTDHLGNVRVTFTKNENTGEATIIQEDHYYPFGMRMNGLHCENTNLLNKYLYNGKEQQEQTLYYDYGFRQYDAQLGRWHVIDAMAEKYLSTSPYAYVMNDPINHTDIAGLYRGGGNQWTSYPRPYLDSNSSRVGGEGMNFRNNMTGTILGLNTAHNNMRELGPTRKDHDDWVAAGKPFGDFGIWYKKQNDAARKAGFSSRQEAIAAGKRFSFHKKEKTYWTTMIVISSGIEHDGAMTDESNKNEIGVQIIETTYYETEYYCYASEYYSDSDYAGGIAEFSEMGRDDETRRSSGFPDYINIDLIMANASSQYENVAATPDWFRKIFGYAFHLFEGYSKGDELHDLFTNSENSTKSPYPIDTMIFNTDETLIDSNYIIKYSNGMYIEYWYAGDTVLRDTTYRYWHF